MATQVMGQSSGGGSLFNNSANMGMALPNDMYDLHELSKAELAAPQLIMLANVALTGEASGSCCDYLVGEERQMTELMPVGDNHFSDSEGEGLEESADLKGDPSGLEDMELGGLELSAVEPQPVFEASAAPEIYSAADKDPAPETPVTEDKCKNSKAKPFRCKPCQYEAESEEQFVHHIRVHSAKKFFVEESAEKQAKARESGSSPADEGEFSKGPIRCDRCGYNTNRYDHYTAHLKHHLRAGENERVYKCIICTYTTVSEYHWRKHLRNHFPRKVYTCSKCNYFSDRKNNYVQHVRTHTGERPYKCELCPYSSSQKTHLTRHMRTHSGEKPFKCDQCNYVASNQHEVTRHARQVHNGPKPLNCPHCDYKTADRSNFKKHVELHVNPRQFNCPVCDYAASKKCNLQYHFKSKHPTCPSKTMDVSKVKLKKTKKREADLLSNAVSNEKTETEQTKTKGDVSGKKNNEKPVKVMGKDASKEKKPCSSVSVVQVTTRTRKSAAAETKAAEVKHTEGHTGNNPEKPCKAKKNKRKMDAEAHLSDEPVSEGPVTKKKKKTESKSKTSTDVPKAGRGGEGKGDKKQSASLKKGAKKTPPKKTSKKGGKLAPKGVGQSEPPSGALAQVRVSPVPVLTEAEVTQTELPSPMDVAESEPAQTEEVSQTGPPQVEPALMEPSQPAEPPQAEAPTYPEPPALTEPAPPTEPAAEMEPSPAIESSQKEPPPSMEPPPPEELPQAEPPPVEDCLKELPSPVEHAQTMELAQTEVAQPAPTKVGSAQEEPPPVSEPPQVKPAKRSSPRRDNAEEELSLLSEMARQEQVLMGVGLVPVRDSRLLKESKSAQDAPAPRSPQPKGNSREDTPKDQEMFSDGQGNKLSPLKKGGPEEAGEGLAESAASKESASVSSCEQNSEVPEGGALHSKSQTGSSGLCDEEVDTEQKTDSVPVKDSAAEPVSPPTPTVDREAASPAVMASPPITLAGNESQEIDEDEGIHSHDGSDLSDNMSEGSDDSGLHGARPTPPEATSKNGKAGLAVKATEGEFVCIFCDRSFRKEKDYSKHLNRHLVNVYFLEEAAEEQEQQEEQEEQE
ncbi:RE1-silencing transcription factor isoform X2 [Mus pahari]|nr:RE1-silencing transcription factor isoform X2 [Mus pahari]XP_021066481.1 RE1-silencing transcription factor isoform X2 [Mus pahari]